MTLDLEPVEVSALFTNSLSIVREKAAARHIRLTLDAAEELGVDPGGRAQGQADRLQPALQRGEVHRARAAQVTLRARRVPRAEVGELVRPAGRAGAFPWPTTSSPSSSRSASPTAASASRRRGSSSSSSPFSQIDSGLARKFEGTGLGLAMVKLLAELHGGTVAVESAVGEGSRFTVWLPLRARRSDASVRRPGRQHPPQRLRAAAGASTALVVEDDLKSAELIRVQLEARGLQGAARGLRRGRAGPGRAAAARRSITLDIMLPNMDGWEFLDSPQADARRSRASRS